MGFFPADPRRLVTKLAATDYDPQAECPHWLARLEEWLPEEDKRRYIQEWAGLSLTGDASQHAVLLLYGRGRNGKGMIVNTIGDMLGDYCVTIDTEVLIAGERRLSGNAIQEQKFNMRGARMMRPSETAENGKVSSKDLKSLASTDMIRGRLLRQNSVEFRMSGKLWIPINHRPEISDTTDSIWERLKVIEFTKRFLGDKRIPEEEIKAQLRPEWPGILNWALVGLRRIMRVAPDGSVRIQISDPAFLRR
jgi:putative DNA primase/helicase